MTADDLAAVGSAPPPADPTPRLDLFLLAGQFPGTNHTDTLSAAVAYARAAEAAGFDGVWLAEHHFISYGVCPSALVMAGYPLGHTTGLRVGTAAAILSNRHPVALAEEAALLDAVSGGRFDLGVARGGPWVDLEVFGTGLRRFTHGFAESLELLLAARSGPVRSGPVRSGQRTVHAPLNDPTPYTRYLSAAGLRRLQRFVTGIGPDKTQVITRRADNSLGAPTDLVARAHAAGLVVHPYTFRAENRFLPADLRVGTDQNAYGRAIDEQITYLRAGVDGLFTDHPDIGVLSRALAAGATRSEAADRPVD